MGNDTRPSRRVKDDDNSNSKGKQSGDGGLSAATSAATSDSSGLRRSSRETLAKKVVAPTSPSVSVRKSERLEKKLPKATSPAQKKLERAEKKSTPSLLRKSDRGKATLSISSPSASASASKKSDQNSGSSSMKQKKSKKEKSVKELTSGADEAGRSEKCDSELRRKRLDGRSYKAIFKKQPNKVVASDHSEKHEREDKFSQVDSNVCQGECDGIDGCIERTLGELVDDDVTAENADDELEIIPENCSEAEKVKEPEFVDSPFSGRITENGRGLKNGKDVIPSNRKRIRLDGDSDALVTSTSKKVHTSIAGTTSLTKERGEHEVNTTTGLAEKCDNLMQQKESPRDLQTGGEQYACFACKLGGKLLCCDGRGCKRSYHFSCLDPPMDDVPLGVWYCVRCVKRKLEFGVHSVSEGVESIWDVREVEVLDVDGLRKEREFFVKYKGIAHIHNRWVPENELLLVAPSLVAKFKRKGQVESLLEAMANFLNCTLNERMPERFLVFITHTTQGCRVTRWKQEWTLPQRLLQKRLLLSPKQRDRYLTEHAGEKLDTHYEWLVKWQGLDYEHVTWELDNALLFSSPDGQSLLKDYESQRNRVNRASSPKADKILESKKCSVKLPLVQCGISSPADNYFSDYVNRLHDFWLTCQNAVVIEEQEGIMKLISLIKSFQPNACQPLLIISTSPSFNSWDDEFLRLAPQVNVVVYDGNKDLRRSIRKLEFYGERGCLILQVLITTLEIVVEDLDVLKSIEWELLIIDESHTRISSHCAQIKLLATKRRLLLVRGQLKESSLEYLNLLSLLEPNCDSRNSESLVSSSSDIIGKLKEKFSKYVVNRCKSDSPRFREYWVPVQLSNVQLEQYCATLISKSALLCSPQKHDLADALQDLLISIRKCCDHPYLVDRNIPVLLYKGQGLQAVQDLGIDTKASGKLQLLDMMLSEIKKRHLRVLILFQDFGRDSIGDILDDFLRQRFGADSYERVVWGLQPAKKQAVLDEFNKKEPRRFVLLIETRACHSSIRLSSANTVIIFGSDWNPVNDMRALQKITLDSQAEQITVFRLYSSFTLEEKVLTLAKQGKILDVNIQSIARNASHMLLMWGASHQFQTLDTFHGDCVTSSETDILFKDSSLEDITQDSLQIIFSSGKDTEPRTSSMILNVQQIEGAYRTESLLTGEIQSEVDEGQPSLFWSKLLEGKHPQWKFINGSSQRNRKRVKYFEIGATGEGVRKRKKVVPSSELGSVGKTTSKFKEGIFGSPPLINDRTPANCTSTSRNCNFESEGRRNLRHSQKNLHRSLKPEILKLCKILKFLDNAQGMVEEFLEYVMNNHHFSSKSTTILQACQISLCWTVAAILKQKIDHKESIALAKQHLNFNCSKYEADVVYSIVRCLKGMFLYRTGKLEIADSPRVPMLSLGDSLNNHIHGIHSPSSNERKLISQSGLTPEIKLAQNDVSKSIKEIQKTFQKKLNKLTQKQQEEKNGLLQSFEADKGCIEERKKMEIVVIYSCLGNNTSMRVDRLRSVDISFAKEFENLEHQMDTCLKMLEAEHLAARRKIQDREAQWVDAVKSWVARDGLLGKRSSNEPDDDDAGEVTLRFLQTNSSDDGANDIAYADVNPPSPEVQICNGLTVNLSENKVQLGVPERIDSSEVQLGVPETMGSSDVLENLVSGDRPLSEEQIPETTAVRVPINEVPLRVSENESSGDGDTLGSVTQMSLAEQIPDSATLNVPSGENTLSLPETSDDEVEVSQTSEENDEIRTMATTIATGMNQQDMENNVVDPNSLLQELSQVNSSSMQPAIAMTNGDPVSANQEHEDERTLPSISCGLQLGDVTPSDEQNVTEEVQDAVSQPVETALSSQSDLEATVSEPDVPVHLSPMSTSCSSYNAANVPIVGEVANLPSSEGCTFNAATELVANPPLMLNRPVSQPSTSSLNQHIDITIGASRMNFPDLRTSVASEFNNHPAQTIPVVPLVPQPQYDVLQKELERLCKEFDQTCKGFEDKKLHLKAECDKEIAQVLLKYEIKQQEVDAEVLTKRKEFHDNHNKVWMNKFLADAFRFKCMELRSSGRSGKQQDVNASYMQQMIQLSLQQNAQRPLVASTSTVGAPSASVQTLAHEPQTSISAPMSSPHSTPPLVQNVSSPSALFPSATPRPPQISSLSSANGNLQGGGSQIRARAPHLRSLASTTSLPPRPHRMSTLPPPTNAPTPLSNSLPCLPPRSASSTSIGSSGGALRPETSRGLPALSNRLSALELFKNIDRPPAASPSVADGLPNTGQLNSSEFGTSNVSVNPNRTSAPTDVVYLSDDD